ncbi:hypothetical protein EYF80_047787 [Liparis tanakae]|uniref:Uncharacterized protein n=1 Tax=Liparis tanakae TaxID=230148 RepID=A0A4Z2FMF3_9TELE|nr:hypothetical protein EYF80_047787 [Liparis tanakae]
MAACFGWKSCAAAVKGNAGKGSLGSISPWAAAISVIVDLSPWMCGQPREVSDLCGGICKSLEEKL